MVGEIPALDKQSIKSVDRFLDKFFKTLHSNKSREKKIVNRCQPWPPSAIDHTTPDEKR